MRFPGGDLRLVDFGCVRPAGGYCVPGHSRRYCAPEVARAVLRRDDGGAADTRVEPSMDLWATGLVLYELFLGAPRFGEAVSYKELAASGGIALPKQADELIGEAHCRLLSAVLLRDPSKRPSAQYMVGGISY